MDGKPKSAARQETRHRMGRRCFAWDYASRCIYLITVTLADRSRPTLGKLVCAGEEWAVAPSETGRIVEECWRGISRQWPGVETLASQLMPDHFHGVIFVKEPQKKKLGNIVGSFKSRSASLVARRQPCDVASRLWAPGYVDVILFRKGQLENIIQYVQGNPRRAIMRALFPDLFQRRQHISINGQDYAAYGNLFLLKRPWKEQVFCHRWKMTDGQRDYNTLYETTDEFLQEREAWIQAAKDGAVLVTPGISKGEQQLVKDCIEQALPLIQLQKELIPNGWNPEKQRHQLCEMGQLLILFPWQLTKMDDVNGIPADTDYSQFHNMNALAERICNNEIRQDWRIKNI